MKKTSTVLLVLSFLFALAAMVIALVGTFSIKRQTASIAQEVEEDLAELDEQTNEAESAWPEGWVLNEDVEPRAVAPEDLGFTFMAPDTWGAFTLTHRPGMFVGGGDYEGAFEKRNVTYVSTLPEFMLGRGGYYGDTQGYRKTQSGYEINFLNQAWNTVPDRLVLGEIETKNGIVLIVSLEETDEPGLFSGTKGERIAILNIPNGPVTGGVFRAGSDVTRDEFRALLSTLEFIDK